MEAAIKQVLHDIEVQEQVSILYACESGSRAWGFASHDSDYDVRFLYASTKAAYLRLDRYNCERMYSHAFMAWLRENRLAMS